MGRPRRNPTDRVATAVRLPRELHDRLRQVAEERATSVTHLLVKAAESYLERLPPLDDRG